MGSLATGHSERASVSTRRYLLGLLIVVMLALAARWDSLVAAARTNYLGVLALAPGRAFPVQDVDGVPALSLLRFYYARQRYDDVVTLGDSLSTQLDGDPTARLAYLDALLHVRGPDEVVKQLRREDDAIRELFLSRALSHLCERKSPADYELYFRAYQGSGQVSAGTWYKVGVCYSRLGREHRNMAWKLLKRAEAEGASGARLYFFLGRVARGLGKIDIALAYYDKSLELEPTLLNAYDDLYMHWAWSVRDLKQAELVLEAADRTELKEHPAILLRWAQLKMELGDYEAARDFLTQARENIDRDPWVRGRIEKLEQELRELDG